MLTFCFSFDKKVSQKVLPHLSCRISESQLIGPHNLPRYRLCAPSHSLRPSVAPFALPFGCGDPVPILCASL